MRTALLLFIPTLAFAASGARPLDLQGAVHLALEQNPALRASAEDVDLAQGALLSSRGLDDLALDGTVQVSRSRHSLLENVPVQEPRTDAFGWSVGLTQPLPTGGAVGLTLVSDLTQTTFASTVGEASALSIQRTVEPSLQLSITHPLLRGFGVGVARAPRHKAEAQVNVANAVRAAAASELIRAVVAAYWDYELASRQVEVTRSAAQAAREQLEIVKANMQVGKLPPTASAEIEVTIAQRDDDALQAEQLRISRLVELSRLLGVSPSQARELKLAPLDESAPEVPELSAALQAAGDHAPQLLAARAQIESARVDVTVANNGLLPKLDLALSGGPAASSPDVNGAVNTLRTLNDYVLQGGLVFHEAVPLRDERGKRQQAYAALAKARFTEADVLGQLESQLVVLDAAAHSAMRRIQALAPAERAARLDLEGERARFQVGRATNFDVLRRQQEVADAQLRMAQARTDLMKAHAGIEALTGDLLARYGVTFR